MAGIWRTDPPYPNWRDYAPAHTRYVDERLARRGHQLPEGVNFREWFAQNEGAMRENAALRGKNVIVAAQFLPIFEVAPENWEAVTFLNHGTPVKGKTLAAKLTDWLAASPAMHQAFITRTGAVFGVKIGGQAGGR